jgi:chorismate synthase
MPFRFLTAGESHGPALTTIIEGMPAGVPLLAEQINHQLARRQQGYGRGGRMKIETDKALISAGVRHGATMGSPIALTVVNSDFASWGDVMKAEPVPPYEFDSVKTRPIEIPRPGHVDFSGYAKYRPVSSNGTPDMRNILERASARETTMRVAAGAVARRLLEECGIFMGSHIVRIGAVTAPDEALPVANTINELADASPVRCLDKRAEQLMVAAIDEARDARDTVGGIFEVVVDGLPVGLGSHVHWDRKLDGRLAGALMSIHAMKGVEIGMGFASAGLRGSQVHDPFERGKPVARSRNNAGGLEGGVTNGEPLVCRVAMKPISTLMNPLPSVNLVTGEETAAHVERSDYCAVPAAGVVGEAMVAIVLADALLEKFGGDTLSEIRSRVARHRDETMAMAQHWETAGLNAVSSPGGTPRE